MGIFFKDKKQAENAVQVNDVSENPVFLCGWDGLGWRPLKKGFKPFGELYLQLAVNFIYDGVSNISFETTKDGQYVAKGICSFIDNNAPLLVNQWLWRGFLAVRYDKDHNYSMLADNEIQYDQYRRVTNRNTVVVYSPSYQVRRVGYMKQLRPQVELIDTLANTMSESCGTMGVLPIISGQSIPANPKFKEDLANAMSKEYGWGADQLKYFLSQSELKVDKIDMQVKDLELRDNLVEALKVILQYLGIPVDLVIGDSTYSNVEGARVYFYETTVRKYAEAFLKLARNLLTASNVMQPQSVITYRMTNVKGLDTTLSDRCKEREAYIDVLKKLAENGVDISGEMNRIFDDLKKDYLEV